MLVVVAVVLCASAHFSSHQFQPTKYNENLGIIHGVFFKRTNIYVWESKVDIRLLDYCYEQATIGLFKMKDIYIAVQISFTM